MLFSKEEVLKGLRCCAEFLCDECPYYKFHHHEYKLRCTYFMIKDLDALVLELPEVVRCKYCKFFKPNFLPGLGKDDTYGTCTQLESLSEDYKTCFETDYCSKGIRKETT